ncbi:MAG TPA: hypothetical protein QGH10_25720 [Armatimonadota bacterium]|jgi:hypothetical protein|nr:hypothetical protein [Armatimonadota bacterium]
MDASQPVIHEERQPSPWWVWLIVAVVWLSVVGTAWGIWQEWSKTPAAERSAMLWIGPCIGLAVLALIHVVLGGSRVAVTDVEVQFYLGRWPRPVRIAISEIRACRPVTYRPIAEFGGWGIRRGRNKTWAYTSSGNRGLLLYLQGERRALLGSDNPETLASILSRLGIDALEPGTDVAAPME